MALAGCGGGESGGDAGETTGAREEMEPPHAEDGQPERVRLEIHVSDGRGDTRTAELSCGVGAPRATGFLSDDAARACRDARRLAPLLTTEPDEDRVCTQVYGGPETARMEGELGDRDVDRRLGRSNGCEIAAWNRAEPLLGAGAGR